MTDQLKQVINAIANELKPVLIELHEQQPTTKDYYGDYMNILSKFSGNSAKVKLIALALIYAGANVNGVDAAVKIITG